ARPRHLPLLADAAAAAIGAREPLHGGIGPGLDDRRSLGPRQRRRSRAPRAEWRQPCRRNALAAVPPRPARDAGAARPGDPRRLPAAALRSFPRRPRDGAGGAARAGARPRQSRLYGGGKEILTPTLDRGVGQCNYLPTNLRP